MYRTRSTVRNVVLNRFKGHTPIYSETLNKEYIERIHQMSYSSLSDNKILQIFIFLIE